MLKPGTYVLSRNVHNPNPDRRKRHDWRAVPVFRAGQEFLVVDLWNEALEDMLGPAADEASARARRLWTAIQLVGARWSHQDVKPKDELYAVLEVALAPAAESLDAMLTRLDVHNGFARWLVESEAVDRALFERLWDAYLRDDSSVRLAVSSLLPGLASQGDPAPGAGELGRLQAMEQRMLGWADHMEHVGPCKACGDVAAEIRDRVIGGDSTDPILAAELRARVRQSGASS